MSRHFPDGVWRAYRYEVFIRGKWVLGGYYGGDTKAEADAKAIDRLRHLWSAQVKQIRRLGEVIWDRREEKAV